MEVEESMRIGIVTQPLYANYGGILQNYALQQVLKTMGHTPVTLDYMPSLSFGRYLLYAGKGVLCALSPSRRHPIKPYRRFLERPDSIDTFVRNQIDLTRTIQEYTKKTLRKYGIETLIVGSDQVWRYAYASHYIQDMYLDFAREYPCRKIAYGASFGTDIWDYPNHISAEIKNLAKAFDAISVREDSGVTLCRENLGITAQTVLDPTLLLNADQYERFCTGPEPEEAPYLAAYVLDQNDEKNAYIQALAESKRLNIRQMTVSEKGASIEEWLTSIRNAAFVVTDSYHGSLFSIIFRKQFQTFINKERGADRFLTLFGKMGLTDRLLDKIPTELTIKAPIDYTSVEMKLQQLKVESIAFLRNSIK